jgi:Fe2+ transport system protein FeoA
MKDFKEGDSAKIVQINGSTDFQAYLLTLGISKGTIIVKNYSPQFSQLTSFSLGAKMISLRKADFDKIELVKI